MLDQTEVHQPATHGSAHAAEPGSRRLMARRRATALRSRIGSDQWPSALVTALIVGALILVPFVVAYVVSARQVSVYEAQADLVFASTGNANSDEQALVTQIALMESRGFLVDSGVVQASDVADLEEALTVERVGTAGVVRLSVRDVDADLALSTVTAISESYLSSVTSSNATLAEQSLLTPRLAEATQALAAAQDLVTSLANATDPDFPGQPDPAVRGQLERARFDRTTLADQVARLQTRLDQLEVDALSTVVPVEPLGAPYLLDEPVSPQPLQAGAAGALVGALVAGAVLVVRQRRTAAG